MISIFTAFKDSARAPTTTSFDSDSAVIKASPLGAYAYDILEQGLYIYLVDLGALGSRLGEVAFWSSRASPQRTGYSRELENS